MTDGRRGAAEVDRTRALPGRRRKPHLELRRLRRARGAGALQPERGGRGDACENSSAAPDSTCVRNQSPAKKMAGTSKKNGKKRIGIMMTSRASGNMRMKLPSTPAIAPEAPSAGIVDVGLKIACATDAHRPQAR